MAEFDQELEQVVDGVEEEAAETVVPSTAATPATRQPEKQTAPDLTANPKFREYQASMDRKFAQMQRELAQAREQAVQAQQQFEQTALNNMPDDERMNYITQRLEARAVAAEKALYERQVEESRQAALQGIATKAKVPVDVLATATSPDQAWELAWDWHEQERQRREGESEAVKQAKEQKRAANKPDLGGGAPAPVKDEWEREYDRLKKAKDTGGLLRHVMTKPKD